MPLRRRHKTNPHQLCKTLRVWISNTVEDQVWQGNGLNVDTFDFTPNMDASYRVKIEGCLLDAPPSASGRASAEGEEAGSEVTPSIENAANAGRPRENSSATTTPDASSQFSHFLSSIAIDFDQSRFRNGAEPSVLWKRAEATTKGQPASSTSLAPEFDELTFKRNGDENINITINLHRHETPERYRLSPELTEVVDMSEGTQQEAVAALWEYIRFWNLQEDEEKRNFRCDELLKKVWLNAARDSVTFALILIARLLGEAISATFQC